MSGPVQPAVAPLHPLLTQSLFVAGTDTGVGKTWVATRLLQALGAAGYRAAGMKPVAAGAEMTSHGLRNDDALELAAAGNVRLPYHLTNPLCLPDATSPHLAAHRARMPIDVAAIRAAYDEIRCVTDVIIAEGAGGWHAPIGEPARAGERGPTMQEVALALQLPVVLVVGVKLGCLNHALLSADAIRRSGLPLLGWIANQAAADFADAHSYCESLQLRLPEPMLWSAPRVILPGQ
ncbi:MAG: dethiobiotin synthase [Steroidobacteraceae bacterium]